MPVSSARGMRDFTPRDKERRDHVMAQIRSTYLQHGFEEIETPAVEDIAHLHSGLGGDNEKLSFSILKRGLETADLHAAHQPNDLADLGLRFDLTVPLARFYASHQAELPPVFRSFHQGPVWRAERPQKGRYRQFVQCDIDILGEPGTLAEVEVMLATADALDGLGVTGYTFRVNDRRLLQELLNAAGIPEHQHSQALITVDKLDKIGQDAVLQELGERLQTGWSQEVMSAALTETNHPFDADHIATVMGGSQVAKQVAAELREWVSQVERVRGVGECVFDPTLVRGMGYYTGSIVEISHPGMGISVGGGGRYDGMIGRFLGTEVPAFGVSLGFERLLEVLPEITVDRADRVALLYGQETPIDELVALKQQLVNTGHTVRLVQAAKNMRPVFERLATDGFSKVSEVPPGTTDHNALSWRDLT